MRNRSQHLVAVALIAAGGLSFAACGKDDGNAVRGCGAASGSGSASGSSGNSGSGSASGSGTSCTTTAPKCVPVGDQAKADTTIAVTLDEWTVTLARTTVAAGVIHFAIRNAGKEAHEFVVVEAASTTALPRDKNGALAETKLPKGSVVGEVEPFPPGKTCDGTFDLAKGTYQLICNIVETDDGKTESHLHQGMIRELQVA